MPVKGKYKGKRSCNKATKILSDAMGTLEGVASAIGVSTTTIANWRKKYPEFEEAIITARPIGTAKFYDKLAEHMFEKNNTQLITLFASSVHGIRMEKPEEKNKDKDNNITINLVNSTEGLQLDGKDS